MKTIIIKNGETIRSSCEPLDITYDRHNRTVEVMEKGRSRETFKVLDDRLAWLQNENTGLSEVLAEFKVE